MMTSLSRRGLFAGVSGLLLAGCADVVGPPPAPKLYTLSPPFGGALDGPKVSWALMLAQPEASAGLDSDRIAITRPPAGLDYYADAAWADRLPLLVETALLEAFERSKRIVAVARESDGARADVLLATDLRAFAARYDAGEGAPLAVVRVGARLVNARTRKIVSATVVEKTERAAANTVPAAVAALTTACGAVLADVVPWVLNQNAMGV